MGLDSSIIPHVDEPTISHCQGGGGREGFIHGIDVPVEKYSVSRLSMTDRCRCHEQRYQREKSSQHTKMSGRCIHLIFLPSLCRMIRHPAAKYDSPPAGTPLPHGYREVKSHSEMHRGLPPHRRPDPLGLDICTALCELYMYYAATVIIGDTAHGTRQGHERFTGALRGVDPVGIAAARARCLWARCTARGRGAHRARCFDRRAVHRPQAARAARPGLVAGR